MTHLSRTCRGWEAKLVIACPSVEGKMTDSSHAVASLGELAHNGWLERLLIQFVLVRPQCGNRYLAGDALLTVADWLGPFLFTLSIDSWHALFSAGRRTVLARLFCISTQAAYNYINGLAVRDDTTGHYFAEVRQPGYPKEKPP